MKYKSIYGIECFKESLYENNFNLIKDLIEFSSITMNGNLKMVD